MPNTSGLKDFGFVVCATCVLRGPLTGTDVENYAWAAPMRFSSTMATTIADPTLHELVATINSPLSPLCSLYLLLHERPEPSERLIPLLRDLLKVVPRLFKAPLLQSPNALAPAPCAAHEPRFLHHAQMLGDRLAGDV